MSESLERIGATLPTWKKSTFYQESDTNGLTPPFHKGKGLAINGLPEEKFQDPCKQEALLTELFSALSLQYTDPSIPSYHTKIWPLLMV